MLSSMLHRLVTWHRPHPGWLVVSPPERGHRLGSLNAWWVNADASESMVALRGVRVAAGWGDWRLLALVGVPGVSTWPRWLVVTRSSRPEAWHRLLCCCRKAGPQGLEPDSTQAMRLGG